MDSPETSTATTSPTTRSQEKLSPPDPHDVERGPQDGPTRELKGFKWAVVVVAILSATFLYALDNTVMADIQPAIVHTFGHVELIPWGAIAYTLSGCSLILVWTKFYDLIDGKKLYILAIVIFEIGSAICGAAPNMECFIVGRAIAGGGGIGMYLGIVTLLSSATTEQERPLYLSMIGFGWAVGTVLGPLIGGGFTDSPATWRWAFYINLVVGAVFSPVYIFLLPSTNPDPTTPILKKLASIDWIGAILSIGALSSGIMGILFGGTMWPWSNARIIALLVLSVVLFIVFGVTQSYTAEERRLFPIHFLKDKTMVLMGLEIMMGSTALYVPVFYLPLLFQFAFSDSATRAAVRLLPFVCVGVFFLFMNGAVMSKNGWYAPWFVVGNILVIIGGALMQTVDLETDQSRLYGYAVLIGAGVGMYVQAGVGIVQIKAGKSQLAAASGYMTLLQWLGVVLALAISGSVFLNTATDNVAAVLPTIDRQEIRDAISGAGSELVRSLPLEVQRAVLEGLVEAIGRVWWLVVAAGAAGLLGSAGLKWEKVFLEGAAVGAA